jgi:hypothetical protein
MASRSVAVTLRGQYVYAHTSQSKMDLPSLLSLSLVHPAEPQSVPYLSQGC